MIARIKKNFNFMYAYSLLASYMLLLKCNSEIFSQGSRYVNHKDAG